MTDAPELRVEEETPPPPDNPYLEVYERAQEIIRDLQVHGTKFGPRYTAGIWNVVCRIDQKDENGRPYLQVQKWRPDSVTGVYKWGHGGKTYLSPHAPAREILGIIFYLFKAFDEHELREFFKYKGKALFGPHISLEALMAAADQLETRDGE